jgi:hypothetical protein
MITQTAPRLLVPQPEEYEFTRAGPGGGVDAAVASQAECSLGGSLFLPLSALVLLFDFT